MESPFLCRLKIIHAELTEDVLRNKETAAPNGLLKTTYLVVLLLSSEENFSGSEILLCPLQPSDGSNNEHCKP